MSDYITTQRVIETHYSSRLKLHKGTELVYLDGEPFDMAKFRSEVHSIHSTLLENDKYIYELTYLTAKQNPFSPIEDYLNECVAKGSQEHPDLDYKEVFKQLNEKVLNTGSNPLFDSDSIEAKYLSRTLVGAVKRIYEPGCQHDTVLILKGKQGLYKSSFFCVLAGDEWFASLSIRNYSTDERMICHSKWIIELGECENTITPSAMSKLKSFITTREDNYRVPYAKAPVTAPRQFILVGSTNQDTFLHDPTGNRRFWVIEITEKIDIEWVRSNRDFIWYAAILAYRDNYPTYLNEAEQCASDLENTTNYYEEDVWQEPVSHWVEAQKAKRLKFTATDALVKAIGKELKECSRSDVKRVTAILQSLGLEKPDRTTRVNGVPGKYYDPIPTPPRVAPLRVLPPGSC